MWRPRVATLRCSKTENIYAVYVDPTTGLAATRLLGAARSGVTYVVEVVTASSGTTLYVYEKDRIRNQGYSDVRAITGWLNARSVIERLTARAGCQPYRSGQHERGWHSGSPVRKPDCAESSSDRITQRFYDDQHRNIGVLDPQWILTTTEYDANGRLVRERISTVRSRPLCAIRFRRTTRLPGHFVPDLRPDRAALL